MDPVTQTLTAAALDRAGLRRLSPLALPVLVVSSVAADLDQLSFVFGAGPFLRFHDALFHSVLATVIWAPLVAWIFWHLARKHSPRPQPMKPLLILSFIGAGTSLLFDLLTVGGVQLLWPFYPHWFALDLLREIDPWILAILILGLLLSLLFRLVSEEIGERKSRKRPSKGAIAALIVVALYLGARAELRSMAVGELLEYDYHGRSTLSAVAFPDSTSPFDWRGVVETPGTVEIVDAPVLLGPPFDPSASLSHFKPQNSPALQAVERTPLAKRFLDYARVPSIDLESTHRGYRATLRDLRFREDSPVFGNMVVTIDLDEQLRLREERIQFASDYEKQNP